MQYLFRNCFVHLSVQLQLNIESPSPAAHAASAAELADEIEKKIFQKLGVGEYAKTTDDDGAAMDVPGAEDPLTDDPAGFVPNVDFDDEDEE